MQLNFNLAKPIYMQIVDEFKRTIARGELKPGDKVPSQRAQKVKVNPNTVQKAYQEMERINLVETLRGQGTFIREEEAVLNRIKEEMAREALAIFIDQLYSLGFKARDIMEMVEAEVKND